MANKLISQLAGGAANVQDTDVIEAQKNGELITKKFTGLQMRQVEKTEREAQDDVIEGSVGLQADGSLTVPANSWFLRAADYAAGCTDRGGATGALSETILNGLRLLDARVWNLGNGSVVIAFLGVNADTTYANVIPAGYMLEYVIFEEKAGQSPILDLGTTAGGNQVFLNQALTTSGLTTIVTQRVFSLMADTTLYLKDDDAGSTWDGSTVDLYFVIRPITAGGAIASVSGSVAIRYFEYDGATWCNIPTNAMIEAVIGLANTYEAGTVFVMKDTDATCAPFDNLIYFVMTDGTSWYVNSAYFNPAI